MTAPPEYEATLRVPPHSLEAEQSVLGGLLLDNRAGERAADLVAEKDFYRHEHRLIFTAIGHLVNAHKEADVITVCEALRQQGKAEDVGGMPYLNSLSASVPSAANMRGYASIVRERAMQRAMIAALDEASSIAWRGDPIETKIDKISSLFVTLERGQAKKAPRSFGEIMVERVDRISALHEGAETGGWPTHFPTLDAMLNGGLRAGGVYVLAARPSVGKSALAAAIGIGMAKDGLPTLFLSQEMSDGEVTDRAISNIGEIAYGNLQTGRLNDVEWAQLARTADENRGLPFYIDDQGSLTSADIRSKARSIKGLKVLVLDYLQLSESKASDASNRNSQIEEVSRSMKALAKELEIAVVVLSQLNRKVEERPGKRPMLSDLRDSGAIEQDADVVIFLWPLKEFKGDGMWAIGCDLPKNRQGKKGAFVLSFWGDYMRWAESVYRLDDLTGKDKSTGGFD